MRNYADIEKYLNEQKKHLNNANIYVVELDFDKLSVQSEMHFTFYDNRQSPKCLFKYNNINYTLHDINYFEVKNLIFEDNVIITILNPSNNIKFINCIFEKDLIIKSTVEIKLEKVYSFILEGGRVNNLIIDKVVANYKFYINPQDKTSNNSIKIKNLRINDSKFIENFKLHKAIVNNVEIEDVDFEKNADFFKTIFKKGVLDKNNSENISKGDIGFKAINFRKLALFGDTEFHKKLVFKHVTFEGHNHFKSSILKEGLDLEYTNVQQEINFYGIKIVDTSKTSQETYRIIKHQFEKLGNKIEANKYHALELDKKRENLGIEIEDKKAREGKSLFNVWLEYIVFKLHYLSSEHSTNWFLALLWILVVGFLSTAILLPSLIIFPYVLIFAISFLIWDKHIYSLLAIIPTFSLFAFFDNGFNLKDLIFNISLIHLTHSEFIFIGEPKELLAKWQSVILFFNKISLGYLYYQFLISVRKDTRK